MPARKRQPSKRKAEEPVEATIDKKKESRGERILSLEHCSLVVISIQRVHAALSFADLCSLETYIVVSYLF